VEVSHIVHSALHQQVRRTIGRHGLCPPGTRVLVGLSGGSDSVGLLLLLRDLAESGSFVVAGAAHFNHRARTAADQDEAFCRNLADTTGISFIRDGADVPALAASSGESFEACARRARYAFLQRAAEGMGADRIAVGHTRDDQAETFLLKLARGAGATGLGGVYPRRDDVIRPLLDVTREAVRAWLQERGQTWVEDETNADLGNPRNRVRHLVLPALDAAYGGPTRAQLAGAAELVREDGQLLDEMAAGRLQALARHGPEGVSFDARALGAEPRAILRRLLLHVMREANGGREVGLAHVELALDVLRGDSRAADIPGGRWELHSGTLVLFPQGDRPK
jgi:tRNA(Ile)-lysidine synthase